MLQAHPGNGEGSEHTQLEPKWLRNFLFFIFFLPVSGRPPENRKNVATMARTYSPTPEGVNTRARLRRCAAPLPIRPLPPLN